MPISNTGTGYYACLGCGKKLKPGEMHVQTYPSSCVDHLKARVAELENHLLSAAAEAAQSHLDDEKRQDRLAELEAFILRNCDPMDMTPADAKIYHALKGE